MSKTSSDQFSYHFGIDLKSAFRNLQSAIVTGVVLFALCSHVDAQQAKKVPRIGFLSPTSPSNISARTAAFRQGLRDLGYVDGKNFVMESRYADGKLDRLPALAAELVRLKVEVVVTGGSASTRAAQETTSTIPIVMTQDPDPIGAGFVTSLARPGGNITGLSNLVSDLSGKRLELLKEIIPNLRRVAVFGTSTSPDNAKSLREVEIAARELKVQLQYLDIADRVIK